eukprot:Skav214637  [mRNA]  locus=scaffold1009:102293:112167:- [translate_table: standard]
MTSSRRFAAGGFDALRHGSQELCQPKLSDVELSDAGHLASQRRATELDSLRGTEGGRHVESWALTHGGRNRYEQMSEVIIHLRTVQNEVQNRHAEVDFAPVLDALASSPLHESISEVRSSLEQTKAEMASNTQQLFALWSQLPPIDFAPIFDCIASNRVELDLSPVLAAIQAWLRRFEANFGQGWG